MNDYLKEYNNIKIFCTPGNMFLFSNKRKKTCFNNFLINNI